MISSCSECSLAKGRTRIVNGEGSKDARIVFIGEAPGAEEDASGKPFVGRSGRFFSRILNDLQKNRGEVFITNIVRCRPPGNRRPRIDEIEACRHHLIRELKMIAPEVAVTLGSTSSSAILSHPVKMRELVGKRIPVDIDGLHMVLFPNYHPSAAMRNREMRIDFKRVVAEAFSCV